MSGANTGGGTAGSRPAFDWMGIDRDRGRSSNGDVDRPRPPAVMDEYRDMIQEYWAAPEPPRFGMSVTDLADYQNQLCRYARRRIYGDGADQYDLGNQQKFESMSMDELWTGAREEIADLINYLTMLDIKLGRLIKGFNGANW